MTAEGILTNIMVCPQSKCNLLQGSYGNAKHSK